jgi:phosphotransferase family enzyme
VTVIRDDLRSALEAALGTSIGGRRIRRVDWRPCPDQSSFVIDEVDVELDDGSSLALIAKATSWDLLEHEATLAKPRFLHDANRELTAYNSILSTLDVATPRYYGSVMCGPRDRRLLLERSAGVELWQLDKSGAWHAAARWLARMHSRADAAVIRANGAARHLLTYDEAFYRRWMRRAVEFGRHDASALTALADRHGTVVTWLLEQPVGFIHGEFYSANILVETHANDVFVVRPIDWEMAAIGPRAIDLASLLAGRWTDAERADVASTYFRSLEGVGPGDAEHQIRTLDYCLIHLAVQNLGWSGRWTPPPQHAHDWLGEALRLCAKWNL